MKECPRCERNCLNEDNALNSLSHIDNKTYICSKCGTHSGLCDMNYETDKVEILMHERFKAKLEVIHGKNFSKEKKK